MIRLVNPAPFARTLLAMIRQMLSVTFARAPAAIGEGIFISIRSMQFQSNGLHVFAAWNPIFVRTVAAISRLFADVIGKACEPEIHSGIVVGIVPEHVQSDGAIWLRSVMHIDQPGVRGHVLPSRGQ